MANCSQDQNILPIVGFLFKSSQLFQHKRLEREIITKLLASRE